MYQKGVPLRVDDVTTLPGFERRRSRYRTKSFAALPVTAGTDVLGVLCVTDRDGDVVLSVDDVADLGILLAPVALALARERTQRQAQFFAQAAIVDPSSGLFNRPYFQSRLQEELQRSTRQSTPVSLLMLDVDSFKNINDTFGHLAGDTVIKDVADILKSSVRVFDVCARYGGEEFAVVMPGSSLDSATAIAERIRQRIQSYHSTDRALSGLRVTVSIGVAESGPLGSVRELIERADNALYAAKRAGKNQVCTIPRLSDRHHVQHKKRKRRGWLPVAQNGRRLLHRRTMRAAQYDARRIVPVTRHLNPPGTLVEVHAVYACDPVRAPVDLPPLEPGGQGNSARW